MNIFEQIEKEINQKKREYDELQQKVKKLEDELRDKKIKKAEAEADDLPDILTVTEVAKYLRIGRTTAYELTKIPGFPVIKIKTSLRVPKKPFLRWIQNSYYSKVKGENHGYNGLEITG